MTTERRCYRCERMVSFPDGFPRDRTKSSGRMSICRECDNARSKVRWREVRKPRLEAA